MRADDLDSPQKPKAGRDNGLDLTGAHLTQSIILSGSGNDKNPATTSTRDLARRLLADEAATDTPPMVGFPAAFSVADGAAALERAPMTRQRE
jgi:hypothetical protein